MGREIAVLMKWWNNVIFRVISPGFGEALTSNQLDVSSVCKSLVGFCVAEIQTRVF